MSGIRVYNQQLIQQNKILSSYFYSMSEADKQTLGHLNKSAALKLDKILWIVDMNNSKVKESEQSYCIDCF